MDHFRNDIMNAKTSFIDISGRGRWFVRDDICEEIVGKLRREPNFKMKLLVGPRCDPDKIIACYSELENAEVWILPKYPSLHFSVVDRWKTRVEKPHAEEAEWIIQYVSRFNPFVFIYRSLFELLEEEAIPIDDYEQSSATVR